MNIPTAIARLDQLKIDLKYWQAPLKDSALNLGIEALKRRLAEKAAGHIPFNDTLPSETEK